jgi:hypothetical protein
VRFKPTTSAIGNVGFSALTVNSYHLPHYFSHH